MKKIEHDLKRLIELPDFAQTCDILRVNRVQRAARVHAGKPHIVTSIAQEYWQRKKTGRFMQVGDATTLFLDRSPSSEPYVLVHTSSSGLVQVTRYSDEADAFHEQQKDFEVMTECFLSYLPNMPETEPAA